MSQDTGLIKRGLLLLAMMAALVVVLLVVIFQRTGGHVPAAMERPELSAVALVRTDIAFPGSVSWIGLYQFGEAFPTAPGWQIRYNAALALARRGSPNVPWDLFQEMLDEKRQMRNFRAQLQDGKVVPDEASARLTMLSALRAASEWHKKQTGVKKDASAQLSEVYAVVDKLASHPIMEIKTQAENTRKLFLR